MEIASRFTQIMQRIIHHAASSNPFTTKNEIRLAVAYSGGLDSSVLLHLSSVFAKAQRLSLFVFHVHHGLSPHADYWLQHSQKQSAELNVPFEAAYVQLGLNAASVEATARKKRYAALGELCQRRQIHVLLTAHHQDDQAETILLQLLRGSGVAGLAGMRSYHYATELLGSEQVLLARPLLDLTRAQLEQYACVQRISYIEDESNTDPRYIRNALRLKVMPVLTEYFPGFQNRFARAALHAQTDLALIEQLAQQDYAMCYVRDGDVIQHPVIFAGLGGNPVALSGGKHQEEFSSVTTLDSRLTPRERRKGALDVVRLQSLPEARIDHVLRYWIALHHQHMPSTARLAEMRKQLLHAREDAQVCVQHGSIKMYRYRQRLSIAPCIDAPQKMQSFIWQGEASIAFPTFAGALHFDSVSPGQAGINRHWLMAQQLEIRPRQGGERLKLAANRPTRDMKSHYQTLGIPYWQRERLPFVFVGTELLFAAGVGMQARFLEMGDQCVSLRWQT
jgi:tRNA(Ile)-lysidine synthase